MFGPGNRTSTLDAPHPSLVELYSPGSEAEALLLRSVLDGAGIAHFVKGDVFGSLTVGPTIDHYNRKTFFVHPGRLEEAGALLQEFLAKTAEPRRAAARDLRLRDVIRMVVELLLFGWFMPGRRHRPRPRPRLRLIRGGRWDDREGCTRRKVSGPSGHP